MRRGLPATLPSFIGSNKHFPVIELDPSVIVQQPGDVQHGIAILAHRPTQDVPTLAGLTSWAGRFDLPSLAIVMILDLTRYMTDEMHEPTAMIHYEFIQLQCSMPVCQDPNSCSAREEFTVQPNTLANRTPLIFPYTLILIKTVCV